MKPAFFDAQWLALCARWPWNPGQDEAMRFYRDRLKLRAADYSDRAIGLAIERVCGRPHGGRPPVEEIVAFMRDIDPPAYNPPTPVSEEERARASATCEGFRTDLRRRVHLHESERKAREEERKARIRNATEDFMARHRDDHEERQAIAREAAEDFDLDTPASPGEDGRG